MEKELMVAIERLVNSFAVPPIKWHIGGSRAKGTHRPDSDIDLFCLFAKDEDIPDVPQNIEGLELDFHSFAADWVVYKYNPELLESF